jgi:predicted pyridoxine 5'-phosphate oxidase superfamily flavin-nucleotide-binding protein
MSRHFADIAYTPSVRAEQVARHGEDLSQGHGSPDPRLGPREATFIAERDTAFLGTVNADGWPHVQHRGGPPGFLRVLDAYTLAFADLGGNRQFVSVGNLHDNDRAALMLLDAAHRRRLKILGHMRVLEAPAVARGALPPDVPAAFLPALQALAHTPRAERVLLMRIAAFDWNCSQHITPRWSEQELAALGVSLPARP